MRKSSAPDPLPSCPICGSETTAASFEKSGFRVFRCHDCKHRWIFPRPGAEELLDIYDDGYFTRGGKYGAFNQQNISLSERHNDLWKLHFVTSHLDEGKLLDVGCATGTFLVDARTHGFDIEGIEPSEAATDAARLQHGLEIRNDSFSSAHFGAQSFDAVTLWDVVEHLPDPVAAISKCNDLLRPGGYLFLTTGDVSSRFARIMGRRWHLLTPPQHVSFFSRRSLHLLLERCGFQMLQEVYPWKMVNLGMVLLKTGEALGLHGGRAETVGLRSKIARLPLYLNFFDIIAVAARR